MLRTLESCSDDIIRPWDGMDVKPAIIGVDLLTDEVRQKIGKLIDLKTEILAIHVSEMHKDSPAFKSGMREGDMVILMNNKIEMVSLDKYWIALNGFVPNEVVKYLILRMRDDKKDFDLMEFDVTIGEPPTGTEDNLLIIDQSNPFYGC